MATSSQRIPIRLCTATRTDVDQLARINVEAFAPGIINRLMFPGGPSDDHLSKVAAGLAEILDDADTGASYGSQSKPDEVVLAVAETISPGDNQSRPEIIAFAQWDIWRKLRPELEWNIIDPSSSYLSEGVNAEVAEEFVVGIRDMRRKHMRGDPGICLRTLVCLPTRSRVGAGTALLRWGAELADKEALSTWLEASPQGYRLYRRFGFEDVDVLDLDLKRWGAVRSPDDDWGAECASELVGVAPEGTYRSVGMRRPPVKL